MCLPIAIFVLAIMLPFQFKFGSERGRIVLVLAFSAGILCGQLSHYGEKRVLDEKEEFQSPLSGQLEFFLVVIYSS